MARKSLLDGNQRFRAVMELLRREDTAAKSARRHGVSENTLYRLRDRFLQAGKEGLRPGRKGRGARDARIAELERQIGERDRVIGEITIANRILKKTADGSL